MFRSKTGRGVCHLQTDVIQYDVFWADSCEDRMGAMVMLSEQSASGWGYLFYIDTRKIFMNSHRHVLYLIVHLQGW